MRFLDDLESQDIKTRFNYLKQVVTKASRGLLEIDEPYLKPQNTLTNIEATASKTIRIQPKKLLRKSDGDLQVKKKVFSAPSAPLKGLKGLNN